MGARVVPRRFVVTAFSVCVVGSCHRPAPNDQSSSARGERTVFTDSVLHAQKCAPLKAGEDWRRVCTPLDQSVLPRRP